MSRGMIRIIIFCTCGKINYAIIDCLFDVFFFFIVYIYKAITQIKIYCDHSSSFCFCVIKVTIPLDKNIFALDNSAPSF